MHTPSFIIKSALVAAAMGLSAQANALVETGHWQVSTSSGPGEANFSVSVDQTPGGDYTGVWMNYSAGKLQGVTYSADEGAKLYVVNPGDVFTQASSASATNVFSTAPITVGTEFYLAAKTRSYTDPGFTYDESFYTTFGWAHFKVDASGTPQLLESAMAFREGGIIVGTLQAVPEPSTYALMGIGLFAMGLFVRTSKARQAQG